MSKAAMENRQARCICGKLEPSSTELAFFVYRGEGSGPATVLCKCGYTKHAHWLGIGCKAFEPHGPYEYDSYYCGCQGWD